MEGLRDRWDLQVGLQHPVQDSLHLMDWTLFNLEDQTPIYTHIQKAGTHSKDNQASQAITPH